MCVSKQLKTTVIAMGIYTAVLISQFTSYIFGIDSFKNTDGIIEKYMNTKLGFLYQFEMFSVL